MKSIIVIVSMITSVFFFQNCSKSQFNSNSTETEKVYDALHIQNNSQINPFEATIPPTLNRAPSVTIQNTADRLVIQSNYFDNGQTSSHATCNPKSVMNCNHLSEYQHSIDLATGATHIFEGDIAFLKCLKPKELSAVNSILDNQRICKGNVLQPSDVVCTSVMIPPYAILEVMGIKIELGAANNGCDRGIDLCDIESSKALKSFVNKLRKHRKEMYESIESCKSK